MLSLVLALGGAVTYGIADFLGGLAARRARALQIAAISAPASLAFELVAATALGLRWSEPVLLWGAVSGVASAGAFAFLYAALAIGPMSVIAPLTAVTSATLPIVVGLALGERLGALAGLAVLLGLAAVVLITFGSPGGQPISPRGLLAGTAAGTAIATQLIALNLAPHDSGVAPLVIGRLVSSLVLGAALVLSLVFATTRPGRGHARGALIAVAVAAGCLDSLANLLFLLASRAGYLSISAVIVALYPAMTVLLAAFVLRERLTVRQWAGLGVAAMSLTLFALR